MNSSKGKNRSLRRGAILIIAVVFVAIFSSFGLAMLTMSSTNVQIADNHYKANRALESAQSGLEVMRYWLGRVAMPGTTSPSDRFTTMSYLVNSDMGSAGLYADQTYSDDGYPVCLNLGDVAINSEASQNFSASIQKTADLDVVQMDITGSADSISRTIRVNYNFDTRSDNVFDYGVATKGPLSMLGNIEVSGTNVAVEADVYIESSNQDEALSIIGNSTIAGDVTITNPDAYVTLQGGQAGIGGETGEAALDHVAIDEDAVVEFPVPLTGHFEQYVQNTFDPAVHDTSADNTLENIRIPGGTNPHFSGNTTLNGIVFIESPNVVTFSGSVNITGIIVGDGDMYDNSGANQINFLGNVSSSPVTDLDEMAQQFDQVREETGTFLIAPGFSAAFGGNFDTLNGAIAANGINFFGNAGGTINGSIVNYSDTPMMLGGNNNLYFNRSSDTEIPAGFEPEIILDYVASSYSEITG